MARANDGAPEEPEPAARPSGGRDGDGSVRSRPGRWPVAVVAVAGLAMIALLAFLAVVRGRIGCGGAQQPSSPAPSQSPSSNSSGSPSDGPSPSPSDSSTSCTPSCDPGDVCDSLVEATCGSLVSGCDSGGDAPGGGDGPGGGDRPGGGDGCGSTGDGCGSGGDDGCGSGGCSGPDPGCDSSGQVAPVGQLGTIAMLPALATPVAPTLGGWLGVTSIRAYQRWLSPRLPVRCRYTPTCSQYGLEAIRRYGLAQGARITLARIRRCTASVPPGSHDPLR